MLIIKWVVMFVLLGVIGFAGYFAVGAVLYGGASSRGSVGGGLLIIFGILGFVGSVLCGLVIFWLARSIDVLWPVYLIPVAFFAFHAFYGSVKLLDRL